MTQRICVVGPVYPYRGGIAHFTSVLAREFSKSHEVMVVNFSRLYPSFLFPGKTQYDDSESPFVVESRRVIDSLNPISFWRAARIIAAFKPDFVVFQWWQPFFAVAYWAICFFLKRASQTRIVYLCHNVLPHESSPIDRLLVKIGFAKVGRCLVPSGEDREKLLSFKKDAKVETHPLPILDVFKQGRHTRESAREELRLEGNVALFFGYVRQYKGLDVLLDAFAESQRHTTSTLLVVGEFYDKKRPYIEQIEALGIGERVRVIDSYVPNEEVEKYFCASNVVVLPYHNATQSGIVPVAYAFNRAVIVTSVGGLPDVVEHGGTGFVVPPRDPGALAGAICEVFENGRYLEMEQRIETYKSRFSWSRYAQILLELGA